MRVLLIFAMFVTAISAECPHPNFLSKHFCQTCTDVNSAITFSVEANQYRNKPSNVNTVIMSRGQETAVYNFEIFEGRCVNSVPAEVWDCDIKNNACPAMGPTCHTYHDPNNGHLYYKDTNCETNNGSAITPIMELTFALTFALILLLVNSGS